jgi:restriction endonuclease S subunit
LGGTDTRFFAYLFRTAVYQQEVNNSSRGIVSDRNRLYWADFKRPPSLLLPSDEQAAIVRFLDHANGKIERAIRAKKKLIALLNEQKQVIIYSAVTGRLNICHADVSIGRGVAALVPHGDDRYFAYAMMALHGHLKATFRGSTFPSVTSGHLNNYRIPDPPIVEQRPIAEFIDTQTAVLNDGIDRAYREIGLIREYRIRLVADVVTGKVDVREAARRLREEPGVDHITTSEDDGEDMGETALLTEEMTNE